MLILTILTKELMLTETIDEILNLKIQSFYLFILHNFELNSES